MIDFSNVVDVKIDNKKVNKIDCNGALVWQRKIKLDAPFFDIPFDSPYVPFRVGTVYSIHRFSQPGSNTKYTGYDLYVNNVKVNKNMSSGWDYTFTSQGIHNFRLEPISFEESGILYYADTIEWSINVLSATEGIPASISLSSDKDCIMVGETATVSALVLDEGGEPCPNVEVVFDSDNSNITNSPLCNAITNSLGIATYEYTGSGIGDIMVSASTNNLTEEIIIEDCVWLDNCKTDKLTQYNFIRKYATIEYENEAYIFNKNSGSYNRNILQIPIETLTTPFVLEAELYYNNGFYAGEDGIIVFDSFNPSASSSYHNLIDLALYQSKAGFGKYTNNSWGNVNREEYSKQAEKWYKLTMLVTDGSIQGKIIDKSTNTIIYDNTVSYDIINDTEWKYGISLRDGSGTGSIRNIKMKKLYSST